MTAPAVTVLKPGKDRFGRFCSELRPGLITISVALGCALDYADFDAVRVFFWSAVINGALAPPLILLIVLVTRNPEMGKRVRPPAMQIMGLITFALMFAAPAGILLT